MKSETRKYDLLILLLILGSNVALSLSFPSQAEDNASSDSISTRTEGGIKVRISKTIERSPKLRQEALHIHGYKCQVCHFDFELTYGKWGKEFAEVHHVKPLSELKGESRETNAKTDLAVLCANCHRMVHRKKGITLSLDELKIKMQDN